MELKSILDQICVSHIFREDESLLPAHKIRILNCPNSSLTGTFRHDTRFVDLLQSIINSAVTFELEYTVKILQAGMFGIAPICSLSVSFKTAPVLVVVLTPVLTKFF